MPEYIDTEVKALRDSDSPEEITLLLGVSGDRDAFSERVEGVGATVNAVLGRATLRVTAPKSTIDSLCGLPGLKSIEREWKDVRTVD